MSPTEELTRSVKFKLAESLFIIALLAFTTTLTTAGTKFYRILNLGLTGNLLRVSDLVIAILLFFIIYYIITFISSKINGKQFKDNLKDDGYVYLPLTFAILSYTIIIGFLNPWLNVNQSLLSIIKYSVILLGGLWSLDVLHERAKKYIEMLPHAILIIGIALLWLFMLIPQAPDGMGEDIYQVVSGEIIKMDAFSMGFSPSTLMAKKGDKIILEIINKDITHAFDIDVFNIHEILKPGEVKMVEFVADTKGVFQFYCQVPGHSEAGMNGKLMIT
ncbi:cupredoxin domain-containing protein [Candidatus Woesearchaeota archaeon]|nr:cupredoxin domain-containing protein [Candidatus Woesearchaeota archaeon]